MSTTTVSECVPCDFITLGIIIWSAPYQYVLQAFDSSGIFVSTFLLIPGNALDTSI